MIKMKRTIFFFHKDQYLNYASAKKLTKRSYVNKVFQKGSYSYLLTR